MSVSANATEQAIELAQRRLLPLLLLMYVIAFLDRANIGFAEQALQTHAGIFPFAYVLGAGLFCITYTLLEVPSNLMLHRIGARSWLCRIMVSWGLVSMATPFVRGPYSFYALRLLLGAAEAGLFPGTLSVWNSHSLAATHIRRRFASRTASLNLAVHALYLLSDWVTLR